MNPEKLAELITRTNGLIAGIVPLVKMVIELRRDGVARGEDLPTLDESADRFSDVNAATLDENMEWFKRKNRPLPA